MLPGRWTRRAGKLDRHCIGHAVMATRRI